MELARKIIFWIIPLFALLFLLTMSEAYLQSVRVEEIPFKGLPQRTVGLLARNQSKDRRSSGIHLISSMEYQRSFLHLFQIPYMMCYYAARGKWPYVPGFMKSRVNNAARTFFKGNDSYIRQFCNKWIQVNECFRPIFDKNTDSIVETLDSQKQTQNCNCDKLVEKDPVVYFDKNYIGNVSSEMILTTIDFLQSFLPPPTKKPKRKNKVRGRVDEMDID